MTDLPGTLKIYCAEVGSPTNPNETPMYSRSVAIIESSIEYATIKAGIYADDLNLAVLSIRESYSEVI